MTHSKWCDCTVRSAISVISRQFKVLDTFEGICERNGGFSKQPNSVNFDAFYDKIAIKNNSILFNYFLPQFQLCVAFIDCKYYKFAYI